METEGRVREALVYLRAKIETCSSKYQRADYMDYPKVRRLILNNFFTEKVLRLSAMEAVNSGHLDLYYRCICEHCATPNYKKEEDVNISKTLKSLLLYGSECEFCGELTNYDPNDKDVGSFFFTIGEQYIEDPHIYFNKDIEETEFEEMRNRTFGWRFRRWVREKFKRG
ncbi:MAG: hypothetical protein CL489_10855 [Acidobacteria bacterium]|nr:hypothetical protein [Acidobacteriota bacterium]|tara:strand:- start:12569 stop:13075 length:507 start_codon:yes stop_codon:yes gene_type:complete